MLSSETRQSYRRAGRISQVLYASPAVAIADAPTRIVIVSGTVGCTRSTSPLQPETSSPQLVTKHVKMTISVSRDRDGRTLTSRPLPNDDRIHRDIYNSSVIDPRGHVMCRSRPTDTSPSERASARDAVFCQVVLYNGSASSARTATDHAATAARA